jgi:branched-chain amino acid transport system permease protein
MSVTQTPPGESEAEPTTEVAAVDDRPHGRLEDPSVSIVERIKEVLGSSNPVAKIGRWVAIAVAFLLVNQLVFGPPFKLLITGTAGGSLYGLIAIGIILIYRTNRIVNFAAAGLGAVPAILSVFLIVKSNLPYPIALLIAVGGGIGLGALIDILIIRRFAKAPRLILTVATIGVTQVLAFIALYIPILLDVGDDLGSIVSTPWTRFQFQDGDGITLLTGDQLFGVVVVIICAVGLAAFFRYTRIGIALRASAENADRASLLGIPVRRIGTVAWMLAGLFSALTIFLRSALVGVPVDGSLGYTVLLFALAAAVVAKMESVPRALAAGIAVGILEQSSVVSTGSSDLSAAIMLLFILGSLLLQRSTLSRAQDSGVSSFQTLKEYRPIPLELRNLPEIVGVRIGLGLLLAAFVFFAPELVSDGEVSQMARVPIAAIVAVSLVILTGWAGQISLGQFAIVGVGAVTAGKLAADFSADFFVTVIAAAIMGAIIAVLVGLPAVRIQGLFLAVSTLALAAATEFYLLKRNYGFGQAILPSADNSRIERPTLWERIDLNPERNYYYVCVAFLVVSLVIAKSFRKNRSGRVLIAARDNGRAAPSYGINLVRTRLAAFAVSGAIASVGGALLVYQQKTIDASTYGVLPSLEIFVSTVIGGLTSLPGAVAGAVFVSAVSLFGEDRLEGISLLVTGPGLLFILLFLPGGFAQAGFQARDSFLRAVANRKGILVPSLVADRLVTNTSAEDHLIEDAEHHVEDDGAFEIMAEPMITCPVCQIGLTLDEAATHEHLQRKAEVPT